MQPRDLKRCAAVCCRRARPPPAVWRCRGRSARWQRQSAAPPSWGWPSFPTVRWPRSTCTRCRARCR